MSESDSLPPGAGLPPADAVAARERSDKISRPPFEVSQEPLLPVSADDEPPMGAYQPAPAYEHLGDLPPTYGSQSVYLVAYDPRQLFAYWDVDPSHSGTAAYGLRICRADGEIESEVLINPREAGRYLVTGVPGGTYYVELGTSGRGGRWRPIAFSARVTMPPAGLAGEVEPKFATLPFHLSFQRLLELIQDAMGQGEDLTAALARLQAGDRKGIESLIGTLASLSREQLQTLERLLGKQMNPRGEVGGSFNGASENSLLGVGAGGSETLSSGELGGHAASFGSETLSSQAFGSEAVSSQAFGSEALSSQAFGGEALSSQAFGGERPFAASSLAGESFSSGVGAFGSETLAAGARSFGSESWSSLGLSASSVEILRGLGMNSEVWSFASGGLGLSSESLSSDRTTFFFRGLEGNLANLSSMFSTAFASLSSDFLNSESSSSNGSGAL